MPRGGKRPGAGRPKGSRTKKTLEQEAAIRATGQTPLEYLTSIFQDESKDERVRIDAAKAAAPFVHAKLSNVEMKQVDPDTPADELSDSELEGIAARGSSGTAVEAQGQDFATGVRSPSKH